MAKKFFFIKTTLRGVTVNMNTCFIEDISQITGEKAEVFINGEWWKTKLAKDEIVKLHNAP